MDEYIQCYAVAAGGLLADPRFALSGGCMMHGVLEPKEVCKKVKVVAKRAVCRKGVCIEKHLASNQWWREEKEKKT